MRSEALAIDGRARRLAARVDIPEPFVGFTLLAECSASGKDRETAVNLAQALVSRGWAVVRVDFTGQPGADGDFVEDGTFSDDVDDIVRVADRMRSEFDAPTLIVGHALGGIAALAAATRIPEVGAVVSVSAPFSPDHLIPNPVPADDVPRTGRPDRVPIGNQHALRVARLLDDLANLHHGVQLGDLDSAVLIMHDPHDEVVPFEHAVRIREAVGQRAALVPIEGGHFLRRPADRRRVADLVSVWATPLVKGASHDPGARDGDEDPAPGTVVVQESGAGQLAQTIRAPGLVWSADEPAPSGEVGVGPEPYQLLLSALGACTAMTVRLYADRKGWPLDRTTVTLSHDRLHAVDCAECTTREGRIDRIVKEIHLAGDLDTAQRERLLEIAERCPVHRTLTSEIVIEADEV